MLEVRGLRAGYGGSVVIDGVDLDVASGEFVVVIGPNGHGKTTLLRAISGLLPARGGSVRFKGEDITGERTESIVGRGLVQIPQGDLLFPDMSVQENLLLGAFTLGRGGGRADRLAEVYGIFPRLAERSGQRARTLSGGERRMLALGRGLMARAELLMIDEPSLGLAPVLVDEVYERISRIAASGVTVLLVEENFAHVREVADRVVLVENGSVVLAGTVDEVLENPAVTATYLGVGGE
ncbi:MAG: ABC transporter ATP-binding protein [Candidatus Nanopelagicales bacterium]